MVIFHSYVKLPEGTFLVDKRFPLSWSTQMDSYWPFCVGCLAQLWHMAWSTRKGTHHKHHKQHKQEVNERPNNWRRHLCNSKHTDCKVPEKSEKQQHTVGLLFNKIFFLWKSTSLTTPWRYDELEVLWTRRTANPARLKHQLREQVKSDIAKEFGPSVIRENQLVICWWY